MRVKLIKGYAYSNGVVFVKKDDPIIEVSDDEGQQLLASGYFEQMDEPAPVVSPVVSDLTDDDPENGESGEGGNDPPADDGEGEDDPTDAEKKYIVPPVDFDKMKLNELKAYAADNEIDISGLTRKDEIKERLIEAINSRTPEIFLN